MTISQYGAAVVVSINKTEFSYEWKENLFFKIKLHNQYEVLCNETHEKNSDIEKSDYICGGNTWLYVPYLAPTAAMTDTRTAVTL